MPHRIYVVKVKVNGESGWSGSPLWLKATDHIDAERQAKRLHARRANTNPGNVDAKAVRWDAKSVYHHK